MLDFFNKQKFWSVIVFMLSISTYVFADTNIPPDSTGGGGSTPFNIKITNPLGVSTLDQLLDLVLNLVITIGVPIVTLAIMWSGFTFIKAQGNPGQLTAARENIKNVLIGTAIVLGVFSIVAIIRSTIRALGA